MFLTLLLFRDVVQQQDEVMMDPIPDAPEMEGIENEDDVTDHVVVDNDDVSTTGVCGVWNEAELIVAIRFSFLILQM